MITNGKNWYLREKKCKIPFDLAPKSYLFVSNFENAVETLNGSHIPDTLVEITLFFKDLYLEAVAKNLWLA
jgi:hypothetical protein